MLSKIKPFSKLPESSLAKIRAVAVKRSLQAGSMVFESDEDVTLSVIYVVLSGRLKIIDHDQNATIRHLGSGEIFGHFSLIRNMPLPYRIEITEEGEILEIPNDVIRELFTLHPFLASWFQADLRRFERELGSFDDVAGSRFLFGQRLYELPKASTLTCRHHCSIRLVAQLMTREDCDCVVVLKDDKPIGLVSDTDFRDKVVGQGISAEAPITTIMTTELHTSPANAPVFDGMMLMEQNHWRHLILLDKAGEFCGVVSEADLARTLLASPTALRRRLTQESTDEGLLELRQIANASLMTMHRRGVRTRDLLRMNTGFNDALTVRIIEIVSASMPPPPDKMRWCWLSLGSEGRGEMGLRTDQDNAIIYEAEDEQAADQWLKALATTVNEKLAKAGIELCDGGLMAREDPMRQTLSSWRSSITEWLADPVEERQLWLSALIDCRAVHGDLFLCSAFKKLLLENLQVKRGFPRTLALAALEPPLPVRRFLGRRVKGSKHDGVEMLDAKNEGTRLITNAARLFCLDAGWLEQTDTLSRLAYLAENVPELKETANEAVVANSVFSDLRFDWHMEQVVRGEQPSDLIPISEVGETRKRLLLGAYETVEEIRFRIQQQFGMDS